MPATGLKIVGSGACLPWCSHSSSLSYEFLELFLPDIGFQLLKSLWLSFMYF